MSDVYDLVTTRALDYIDSQKDAYAFYVDKIETLLLIFEQDVQDFLALYPMYSLNTEIHEYVTHHFGKSWMRSAMAQLILYIKATLILDYFGGTAEENQQLIDHLLWLHGAEPPEGYQDNNIVMAFIARRAKAAQEILFIIELDKQGLSSPRLATTCRVAPPETVAKK